MYFHGLIAHFFLAQRVVLFSGSVSLFLWPTEGHLEYLAVMNKVAINIHVQERVCARACTRAHMHKFSVPLGRYQRTWLLENVVRKCSFMRNQQTVSKQVYHFGFFTARNGSSIAWHPRFLDPDVAGFSHSNRYVVMPHCFSLHCPDDIWDGASFHRIICHLYVFDEVLKSLVYFLWCSLIREF